MEPRAGYVAVGAFLMLMIAGLAGFMVWLTGAGENVDRARYVILFDGAVQGLSVGSQVQVQGIPVGTVADLRFDDRAPGQVVAELDADPAAPITEGAVAEMAMQGLTGGVMVQITGGMAGGEVMPEDPRFGVPVIPSRAGAVQAMFAEMPNLMRQTGELLNSVSDLLHEDNQRALTETLINIQTLTEALNAQSRDFDTLVTDVNGLVLNVNGLVEELRLTTAGLSSDVESIMQTAETGAQELVESFSGAADEFQVLARTYTETGTSINQVLDDGRQPLQDFLGTGLYEVTRTLIELRQTSESLRALLTQVERDPTFLLFGNTTEGRPTE